MIRIPLAFGLLCLVARLAAQPTTVPNHSPTYRILDRLEIRSGVQSPFHPEIREYSRRDVAQYAIAVDSAGQNLSRRDRRDLQYLLDDNNEWRPDTGRYAPLRRRGFLTNFYRTPANFYEVNSPHFRLYVNPMFNFQLGRENDDAELRFYNQRGVQVRGDVDRRVYFYTDLIESQIRFPDYVTQRIDSFQSVPGAGFYKGYYSNLFNVENAVDFNVANAYIGFNATRHIGLQFGHGRQFIGNGYRSLLLSDFAVPAFFLKVSTRVWRFHYQNLFLELAPVSQRQTPGNTVLPRKYAAIHYLNYRVTPRLAFGLFEATILNRSRQFELQYLNPVIFYRTVEGMIGSPDNVLLGLDGHWNLFHRIQLYGQFLLDEFNFKYLYKPEQKGYWANKFGLQAGLKYINAFNVDHLDLRLEYNRVRPFTYAHFDSLTSYTHYNQPLAHPLLANFDEFVGLLRYQPVYRLTLEARWMHARTGDNTATENWGANPLLGYGSRARDFGNVIGQGIPATIDLLAFDASWQLYHNLFLDVKTIFRRKDSAEARLDQNTRYFGGGIRMNLFSPNLDF